MSTISSGHTQTVSAGPPDSGTIILAGGVQIVLAGGVADATRISGGTQYISAGGLASGALVTDNPGGAVGGQEVVYSGGTIIGSILESGGEAVVHSGGTARGVLVRDNGILFIDPGAHISALQMSGGGLAGIVGVSADSATVNGADQLVLTSSGTVVDTISLSGVATSENFITFHIPPGGPLGARGGTAVDDLLDTTGGAVVISELDQSVYVSSGQTDSRATIESGAAEVVGYGGKAIDSVLDDAEQYVLSGGSARGATVASGGTETVSSGGTANGAIILSGGVQIVSSGGAADATRVSGGTQYISAGGLASGALVTDNQTSNDNGQEVVYSGGTISDSILRSGGQAVVYSGGTARGVLVGDEGVIFIDPGARISALNISGGGIAGIVGVSANSATVNGADQLVLTSSGTVVDTISLSGVATSAHFLTVDIPPGGPLGASGGTAVDDLLDTAGGAVVISEVDQSVYVSSGQTDSRATIESGAAEVIGSGGKAIDSVVDDAEQYVLSGGSAVGATVSSGGAEIVRGVASGTKVLSGGSGYIYAGGVASGLALAAGGVAIDDGQVLIAGAGTLAGTLSGSGAVVETGGGDLLLSGAGAAFDGRAVISGGTIELAKSGALGTGYVQFVEPSTGSAVLQIDAADAPAAGGTFANVISNFSGAHEDIDLRSIAFVSGASATVSSSTLILTDGGKTYKFKLAGSMAGAYPVLSDGHGGTLIDPITAAPKTTDPTVLAFAHTAAAFAPSDAANSALVSSTSPIGETPFLHATASATAGPA